MTLKVTDTKQKAAELKRQGVRVIDETEWSPTSYEAYISPRSAHGVLIQIGSGYPTLSDDPAWLNPQAVSAYRDLKKPKSSRPFRLSRAAQSGPATAFRTSNRETRAGAASLARTLSPAPARLQV